MPQLAIYRSSVPLLLPKPAPPPPQGASLGALGGVGARLRRSAANAAAGGRPDHGAHLATMRGAAERARHSPMVGSHAAGALRLR